MPIPNTGASAGNPNDASSEMVEQVVARVLAAMREQSVAESAPAASAEPREPHRDDAAQHARHTASGVAEAVQHQAVSRLDRQKDHAVEEMTRVADTVRQMGEQLKQPEHGAVAQYASHYGDVAADGLQSISRYLGEHDVKQLVREVESFARREPLLFTGGAFLLGLMGARFLKSKPVSEESTSTSRREATPSTSTALALPMPEATLVPEATPEISLLDAPESTGFALTPDDEAYVALSTDAVGADDVAFSAGVVDADDVADAADVAPRL